MDGGEAIGHLGADEERAVAAVRIAHQKDLVDVDLAMDRELADQLGDERAHVVVVEAVPDVVWRPQGHVDVPLDRRLVAVIVLHHVPLAVVDLLGDVPPPPCRAMKSGQPPAGFLPTRFTV